MDSLDLSLSLGSKSHLQEAPADNIHHHDLDITPPFPRQKNVVVLFGAPINGGTMPGQAQNLAVEGGSSLKPKRKPPDEPVKRWTEKEHEAFLAGLRRYGKGQWKSISRNYVPSKSPSQISSHAQNYFRRRKEKDGTIDFSRLLTIPKIPERAEVAEPPTSPIRPIYINLDLVPDEGSSSSSNTPNPNQMPIAPMARPVDPDMLELSMAPPTYSCFQ